MQTRERIFYQYALMNLAVLQADFGCFSEAVAVMLETVSTARENKDMPCLNFALNWLHHFTHSHPEMMVQADSTNMFGADREGLQFLRIRAKETGMWSLWSSSLLSEARLGMTNGDSVATAFENLLKSSHLNVNKNMKSMAGSEMAMMATLWSRLGVTTLSRQYCEVFLRHNARAALSDEVTKFSCRLALLLTDNGRFERAMELLNTLEKNNLRSWKVNQFWLRYRGMLRLKQDLRNNRLDGAEQLLAQLLQSTGSHGDQETTFEIHSLHVEYLMRRNDYSGALAKVEATAKSIHERNDDIHLHVKLLITKALLQCRIGRPQRGFSVAVRAASIAWRARLLPALWTAMGAVANILTSLSQFEAASDILVSILPRAMESELCSLVAQLFSYLIDAHMGMAGQASIGSTRRRENLTKSLGYIDRAFSAYSAIEDTSGQCEMMAKKALVMKTMGDDILANDYASAYLDLRKGQETRKQ